MKRNYANKLGHAGAGVGLALYAAFGLMPGAYLGGILGVNTANMVAGLGQSATLLHRALAAMGMLTGSLVAGLMSVVAGACLGWLLGAACDIVVRPKKEHALYRA
jgi:hypothetical protein